MSLRKVLTQFLLICAIYTLGSCSQGPEATTLPDLPFAKELQAALDQALQDSQGAHELGVSAAVIVPGIGSWSGISGESHPGAPLTPEMLFDAGSIAKNFEAALALKLAEQGLINLDDPLSRWLPEYHNVNSQITIRQLLNHTSGVFNVFEHPDFPWVGPDVDYSKSWEMEEVFKSFVLEPYGMPGYAQHYSSTNYLLLTAILERAIGATVPEEVERYFLGPLSLRHTFLSMGEPLPAGFSAAHPWADTDLDGKLEDLSGTPITWKVTLTHPVIYTTPEDLTRWMQALYHDQTVLTPDSLEEMLRIPDAKLRDPEGGLYGLGVVDYSEILGVQAIGHGGSAIGYCAAALYLPEYGAVLAWTINTGESPRELADAILWNTWLSLSGVLKEHLKPQP